ncbi:MAG: GTPase HflX, partial [Massilioclostridium sp.]|nr:GTPase HflX [Massilioclostridium sp.]
MHENTMETTKAVLVSIDTGEFDAEQSLKELEELARTAEVEVAGTVTQRRDAPDSATCIGAGRLDEIKEFCEGNDVDLLIFDLELTATQTRN